MSGTTISSQKSLKNTRAKLPWPLPLAPVRIPVCASPLASYAVVAVLEAWDKADPRAVLSLRCERHAKGRAFADMLLLKRVPFPGLTKEAAQVIFVGLARWLRERAAHEVAS